jgi:hypothetical protein
MKNVFVFVVCGAEEHIQTLHFSLKYIKTFSSNEVYVITDSKRNEIEINHDKILDIITPESLTNHQASIYLKTALHKFLPKGNTYCYLDTDVIALTRNCDEIFEEFIPPIRFASDHCLMSRFSPVAINCNCEKSIPDRTKQFDDFLKENINKINYNKSITKELLLLEDKFRTIKRNPLLSIFYSIKSKISRNKLWLDDNFYFDKGERAWKNKAHDIVMYDIGIEEFAKKLDFSYSKEKDKWINQFGNDFWLLECNHLKEAIKNDLGIMVEDSCWQHWNGGVFLFNDASHEFLERWHQLTLKTFELQSWKTRDQGTLIATVWDFGLQNHQVLDKKWNFLADNNNPMLNFNHEGFFTENAWQTKHKVNFVHVYHHFGDKSWDLWNYIESILSHE